MEERMKAARVTQPGFAALMATLAFGLASVPAASAEPIDAVPADPGVPVQAAMPAEPVTVPVQTADPNSPAAIACSQFADALEASSVYYNNFADMIEGTVRPDYADPTISNTNTTGRTALRQSATVAMTAANTQGLPLEIANPMRSWSFDATKLLFKMGLRGGGETLNITATELNDDAGAVQMACAGAGTHT
jgi:hypothetical protein